MPVPFKYIQREFKFFRPVIFERWLAKNLSRFENKRNMRPAVVHVMNKDFKVYRSFYLPSVICAWTMLRETVYKEGYFVPSETRFKRNLKCRLDVLASRDIEPDIPFFRILRTNVGVEALVSKKVIDPKRKR